MKTRAYKLMKTWCDRLLDFEVRNPSPYIDGGLICPACHVIHGRIADLVYPLTTLWVHEGDARYLEVADRLIDFSEFNLVRDDGSYYNDVNNPWKGISAFSAAAIGEALLEFGERLPSEIREKWTVIFRRLSDFCEQYFDNATPVVNYFAGASAELALAWRVLGDEKYLTKANIHEKFCRSFFDENGLLTGESHPIDRESERGCRCIDMGYDLEESMPLLLRHATLSGNAEKLEFYKARFVDHLEFLLPDGAINNSWGSRHNKWTYWGSRTSDGVIEGLALAIDDPIFARACERALTLWEKCTHDGLLSEPMAPSAGEPTCLHHTFCHAKALAVLVNSPLTPADPDAARLPLETAYGVKSFRKGNLLNVAIGGWRATVQAHAIANYSGSDNAGGALNLLWHESVGAICAATMNSYVPSEPLNMQYLRHAEKSPSMTVRLAIGDRNSVLDKTVTASYESSDDSATVCAKGDGWCGEYSFSAEVVKLRFRADVPAKLILPIVCASTTDADGDAHTLNAGRVTLTSESAMKYDASKRSFNQVGGFEWIPVEIHFDGNVEATITVRKHTR